VWLRALLVWVLLVVLAILNGTGREALLSPRLGATAGHLVSSVLLASLICPTAWLTIPGIAPGTARRAWAVGVLWVVLTIAFEFLAGHYAFGHAWPKLRAKEMVDRGRVELPTPGFSVQGPSPRYRAPPDTFGWNGATFHGTAVPAMRPMISRPIGELSHTSHTRSTGVPGAKCDRDYPSPCHRRIRLECADPRGRVRFVRHCRPSDRLDWPERVSPYAHATVVRSCGRLAHWA